MHILPQSLGLPSVSVKKTCLSLKSSMKFMPKWPAGMSAKCLPILMGLDHTCISSRASLQSSPKSVAGREQALGLQSDAAPADGDVAGFGKA